MDKFDRLLLVLAKREQQVSERRDRIEEDIRNIKETLELIIMHQIESINKGE